MRELLWTLLMVLQQLQGSSAWDCDSTLEQIKPGFDYRPFSCFGRCGEPYTQHPCACDERCPVYQDCCDDFITFCPLLHIPDGNQQSVLSADTRVTEKESNSTAVTPASFPRNTSPSHHDDFTDFENQAFLHAPSAVPKSANVDNASSSHYEHRTSSSPVSQQIADMTQEATKDLQRKDTARASLPETFQSSIHRNGSTFKPGQNYTGVPNLNNLQSLLGTVECRHRTRLISKCPQPPVPLPWSPLLYGGKLIENDEVVSRCETPPEQGEDADWLQFLPVTDAVSGMHLANVYCLLCHGGKVEHAMVWSLTFIWSAKMKQGFIHDGTLSEFLHLAQKFPTKTAAYPPSSVTPRRCLPKESFYPSVCNCPLIDNLCNNGQDSYHLHGMLPFRNLYCLWCFLINETSRVSYRPMSFDIELIVYMKNAFEFRVTFSLESDPRDNAKTFVQMASIDKIASIFPWTKRTCTLWNDANFTLADFTNVSSFATEVHAESDTESEPSLKGNGTSRTQPLRNSIIETAPIGDEENRLKMKNGTTHLCEVHECRYGIPLLGHECRTDLQYQYINILMTCWSPANPPDNKGLDLYSVHSGFLANFTKSLQDKVNEVIEGTFLNETMVYHTEDECFWNTTIIMLASHGILGEFKILELHLPNITYHTLIDMIQGTSKQLLKPLHVCGVMFTAHIFFVTHLSTANDCTFSAIYQPLNAASIHNYQCQGMTMILAVYVLSVVMTVFGFQS